MAVSFLADQIGVESSTATPFTGNPMQLGLSDVALFFKDFRYLLGIIVPMRALRRDDELYPTLANLYAIGLHIVLIIFQFGFIISLLFILVPPFCFLVPVGYTLIWITVFTVVNWYFCKLLNGSEPWIESSKHIPHRTGTKNERWIFLNGVAVGEHWLRSNTDRLAWTFGRKVLGVQNPTTGILFDVLECLAQRSLGFATLDIRNAYVKVKEAIYDPRATKIVFIVHSQGAIEGSMIIDWLLDEVPRDLLLRLEVYTFGNAANHFNNPYQKASTQSARPQSNGKITSIDKANQGLFTNGLSLSALATCPPKAIRHIEHYANNQDFVSRWGVLHFTSNIPTDGTRNRFMGRVFVRNASGHQLNQHYLDNMFTLNSNGKGTAPTNDFMEQEIEAGDPKSPDSIERVDIADSIASAINPLHVENVAGFRDIGSPQDLRSAERPGGSIVARKLRVKDLSRLWKYRNGMSPSD